MPAPQQESLRQLLGELHAQRVATWDPAVLQINIDQRRELVETTDPAKFLKIGETVGPIELLDVEGGTVDFDALLAKGPVVLTFFRFAGCPACNITLPYYQRALYPALQELGASLIAISPQVPDRLREIKTRHDLSFIVASDKDNQLGRRFGITFEANAATQAAAAAKGNHLGNTTGTGTWELPNPTVIVIGSDRVVRFIEVTPDWLARSEAEPVIEAVRALVAPLRAVA